MTGLSWELVIALGVGAFLCKFVGLIVIGARTLPRRVENCLALIPAALITALIMKDTLSIGNDLVVDARAAGVGAAVIAVWRKVPLALVIVIGAGVTAAVRAAS